MTRRYIIAGIIFFSAPGAFAESDDVILEKVRANAAKIYLAQASFTLPQSFHDRVLAPSDKKRLIEEWANESAACLVDALAKYARTTDIPLAELVNDDLSFSLEGGDSAVFIDYRDSCLANAWEAVGAGLPQ